MEQNDNCLQRKIVKIVQVSAKKNCTSPQVHTETVQQDTQKFFLYVNQLWYGQWRSDKISKLAFRNKIFPSLGLEASTAV
jgi:hypothetical protein